VRSKLISMREAVEEYTWDGMTYAHGAALPVGSDSIAFGREMLRQGRKNLHMISHCSTQQTNLLAAAGAIDKIEIGFSGLEVYGLANGLRRAIESGQTLVEDYSNGGIPLRLLGGALNWPFVPATVSVGSDQQWCSGFNPSDYPATSKIPHVIDPWTGKRHGVFSVLRPDVAVIHVTMADSYGNAIMLGSEWSRYELSRAARKVVLQADCIVDSACIHQYPNLVRIPDVVVDAVVYWPLGTWPQCSTGLYDSDEEHMFYMNRALDNARGYEEYRRLYIDSYETIEEYLALIGVEKIEELSQTPTAFLMDPYRKWVTMGAEHSRPMPRS
jgi:glutaconate CoA-transferase, subunit A